jgi:predicted DNA-binding transcriptional regulator YafY
MLGSIPDVVLPDCEDAVLPDASPTARALLALEALLSSPGITADRLAGKLGVSARAARRYVEILREAGIRVESVRGPHGGYRVGRGVRLPPLTFSPAEALGLVMAVLDGHHDPSDAADPVGSALGKIVRVLPEPVATQVEAVRRTTAPAPDRAAARPDPATATALVQACANHRQVRLRYRSEAGSAWVTEVEPWAVVVRHGRWYLLCRAPARVRGGCSPPPKPGSGCAPAGDVRRAYRIDRVQEVTVLDATFGPPADLDPVAMLESHLAVGWEYDVEVVIDAPLDAVAPCLPRALGRLEPLDAGTCRLVGSTSNPTWYAEQLAAVPVPYRIVRCPELQASARAIGERLLAASGWGAPV